MDCLCWKPCETCGYSLHVLQFLLCMFAAEFATCPFVIFSLLELPLYCSCIKIKCVLSALVADGWSKHRLEIR
ncbi:hypothetical protein RHMOL_Rhmol04G0246300 [Rhododendron molle]|uniref:Uncharacterized protein n=1 Tax=Rhododendron molle TaxID=49168 RepID=A0ACC0P675_RHOML|nr:hypothetical protein RHMOL_Rhmol04G0246300 [Rhododendron molle]